MTEYRYFVSYAHGRGFGSTVVGLPEQVTEWDHIDALAITVQRQRGFAEPPAVLNFQLLATTD